MSGFKCYFPVSFLVSRLVSQHPFYCLEINRPKYFLTLVPYETSYRAYCRARGAGDDEA